MMVRSLSRAGSGCFGVLVLALLSCGESTGPGSLSVTGTLTAVSTMPASGTVGAPVAVSPTVLLKNRQGQPQADTEVTFEVTAGGGALTRYTAITDADGTASAGTWTLGSQAGPNTVVARAEGFAAVSFQTTALADRPASLAAATAVLTWGVRAQPISPAPAVRVLDRFGNPVAGAAVEFAVTGGGGTVNGAAAASGSDGVARVGGWTLGPVAGINSLRATAPGLAPLAFTATGTVGPVSQVVKLAGDNQSATLSTAVAIRPRVRVTDSAGNPVAGATVAFTATSGGGAVAGGSQLTDLAGEATVTSWSVGPVAGTNTLRASVGATSASFAALAVAGPPASQFDIEVRYVGTVAPVYQQAFQAAVARWRSVIIGDVPGLTLNAAAGSCDSVMPAVNEFIDDLVIYVHLKDIDGVGNVLGRAGPCYVRDAGKLPVLGFMQFDLADLAGMAANGTLNAVITHEIGHVLGIGTLWTYVTPSLLQGGGTSDPFFVGTQARQYFGQAGGAFGSGVPVEALGGDGTRDSHWRESVLRSELMTGWIAPGANPLSAITIGSLADLGYLVSYHAADAFTVPSASALSAIVEGGVELIEAPMPPPVVVR